MPPRPPSIARRRRIRIQAFTLAEVVTCIAIIGILSAVAVPMLSRIPEVSRTEVAASVVARVNSALITHRQANVEVIADAIEDATSDENAVMTVLTTRDVAVPGSPLLSGSGWPAVGTSDNKIARMRWNGRFFEVVPPGTDGTGLRIK